MALLTNASLLILDEPSCGLGATTKRSVHDAVRSASSQDVTIILTTHDMEEAERVVDECCLMADGAVLRRGCVADMRKWSRAGYVLHVSGKEAEKVSNLAKQVGADGVHMNAATGYCRINVPQGVSERDLLQSM